MTNLSSLSGLATRATALANLILVTPKAIVGYQPLNKPNPDGSPSLAQLPESFVFTYEGEQVLSFESDITDHFVESNITVQSHIALKAEVYKTKGYIGELDNVIPDFLRPVKFIADKLTAVTAFAPQTSVEAELAYSRAFFLYQTTKNVVNSAVAAWSTVSNLISGNGGDGQAVINSEGITQGRVQNKQQIAVQKLYGYWRTRTLFSIQTPWAVMENMAISKVNVVQSETTNTVTDIELTFKKIRMVSTKTLPGTSGLLGGRAAAMFSSLVNTGTSTGSTSSTSFGQSISNMMG